MYMYHLDTHTKGSQAFFNGVLHDVCKTNWMDQMLNFQNIRVSVVFAKYIFSRNQGVNFSQVSGLVK